MNIIDVQDQLKDFSEQQLIREMQMPSGTAPQFLVLSEIQRRKRMRDDFAKREAAQQQTVAQEAVSAAGVPNSGIAGMSEAMAPKSTMAQNAVGSNMAQAMRSGGLAQFGQELSQKVSSDTVEPFLDEVESMASDRFGVDLGDGPMQRPPFMGRIPRRTVGLRDLLDPMPYRDQHRRGGKGGPRPTISNMAVPTSQLNRFQAVPFNEGGPVIKAQEGRYFSQFDEGDIDLNDILDAMARVESGAAGGQNYFGAPVSPEQMAEVGGVGELSAYQVRPTTLLDFGRGYESYQPIFPEITAQIGDGKKYADAAAAYADPAVKSQVDEYLSDPQRARDAAMGVLAAGYAETGDINKAIEAYNAGLPGIIAGRTNEPYLNKVASAFKEMTENRTNLLGMIESQTNPIGLGNVYTANKERIDADPVLYEAVMSRMNPASLAVSTTEDVVAEDEVILPSGEVIAKGGVIPSGTVTSVQQADDIGAPVEPKGGTVGSADEPESDFTSQYPFVPPGLLDDDNVPVLPPSAEDAAAALEAKMNEDLPPAVIMPEKKPDEPETQPENAGEEPADTTPPVVQDTGGSEETEGLAGEIQKLQDRLEKNRDSDKWLALAQAGLALMSSKEPTLLGAAGEAGLSGLTAFREAQERYQEGVIDLINARSKLAKAKGTSGLDADEALSTAVKLEAEARQLDTLDPARANLLRAQAQRLFAIGGLPVGGGGNIPDLSAPAS